jgi:hypothetical protein
MFALGRKPLMGSDCPPRRLRHVAVFTLIASTFGGLAGAAPSPAAEAKTPGKPGKPAPPFADKTPSPTSGKPEAKPATPPIKPRPKVHTAAAANVPAAAPRKDEIADLRSEVKALRDDLNRAIGTPAPTPSPEREQRETELRDQQKKLAAIQAAVAGGLDPAAVAESVTRTESRIADLEASLAQLPVAEAPRPRSLYEVTTDVERLSAAVAQPSAPQAASVVAASAPPKPLIDVKPPEGGDMMEKMGLLPLEFTAFGDFFYRFERPAEDDFHVGAVELDASLKLTPYVSVSTAAVYDGAEEAFLLGAFVIDCGIAGDGDGYVIQSKHLTKSGVSFGRFDVPFGIAYLKYASVDNRLITQPQAVQLTHGGWNDIGAQGYAVGEHWTAVGYVVNGPEHPISADESEPSGAAAGARVSGKMDELFEVGASGALDFAAAGPVMAFVGGDLSATLGPLDLGGEYLLKHVKVPGVAELTHGLYADGRLKLDPAFLVARYDTVLEGTRASDRRIAAGAGVEIFPQGEMRAVYEQSFDSNVRMVSLQLVGGSSFQPTGLRR